MQLNSTSRVAIRILGAALLALPIAFRWYVSNFDRYLRMINGPYPFSHLGSGLYQFTLNSAGLVWGATLIAWSLSRDSTDPGVGRRLRLVKGTLTVLSGLVFILALQLVPMPK